MNDELYNSMISAEKEAIRCRLDYSRSAESSFEAEEIVEKAILESFEISISETPEGWFLMTLPVLLPKKKEHKSLASSYISPAIYAAVDKYFQGKDRPRYSGCTVCFISIYEHDLLRKYRRDHDNIEVSRLLNCLTATGVLAGDDPFDCDLFYTAETGEKNATKVIIRPRFDAFSV